MGHEPRYAVHRQQENRMNEWIIAPLLEPDPTGIVSHTPGGGAGPGGAPQEERLDERRHGERRDNHDDEADPDFARGDDRREDAV
jgi:hypothetical protein